jgi:hypothetical protein
MRSIRRSSSRWTTSVLSPSTHPRLSQSALKVTSKINLVHPSVAKNLYRPWLQSSALSKTTSPVILRGRDGEECLGNRDGKVIFTSIVTKTADKGFLITPATKDSVRVNALLGDASVQKEAGIQAEPERACRSPTVDDRARGDEESYHSYSQT